MSNKQNWILALFGGVAATTAVLVFVVASRTRNGTNSGSDGNYESRTGSQAAAAPSSQVTAAPTRVSATNSPNPDGTSSVAPEGTIEIVRRDTRAPVPGARIQWWSGPLADQQQATFDTWLKQSRLEEQLVDALELRADTRGIAPIPRTPRGGMVVATADGLWGKATVGQGQEHVVVELDTDVDFLVRLVDKQGAPLSGVTVALRQPGHFTHIDHLTARSDGDGIADLRHVGLWVDASSSADAGLVIAVKGLFDPPLVRPIDPTTLALGFIELALEPTGSCLVEVVDGDGRVLSGSFDARLCIADGRTQRGADSICEMDASALFEHVALERTLSVEVTRESSNEHLTARGAGPRRAGERVVLRVRSEASTLSLSGRVIDAGGKSLEGLALSAELMADGRASEQSWSPRTDAEGRFTLELRSMPPSSHALSLVLRSLIGSDGKRAVARIALPAHLREGANDLGDIRLEDEPIVVAGDVVDGEGRPVAEATITAQMSVDDAGVGGATEKTAAFPLSARSDAQGRFALQGDCASGHLLLLAQKPGYVAQPALVRVGERQVHLVLGTAGSITGTVLLDASLRATGVLVEAVLTGAPLEPALEPTLLGNDGRFVLRDLSAGAYSLRVMYAAHGRELGRIDDVLVRADQVTRDARIDPLDLRAGHRLIDLELVDAQGAAVQGGTCTSRESGVAGASATFTRAPVGTLSLLVSGHPLDVSVSAPGYLHMELEGVSASQRVILRPAANARLELVRARTVLPAAMRLSARLTPIDEKAGTRPGAACAGTFDERGVLVCETACVGEMRVDLMLSESNARDPRVAYLTSCSPRTIHLAPHSAEQEFRIDFDPEELERALQSLRDGR